MTQELVLIRILSQDKKMHTENYDPLTNFIRDLSKASTDGYKDLVSFLQKTIMVYTRKT